MLEIAKSRKYKETNHNAWSLFVKSNHRCNNRKATYKDLKYALDNWINTEKYKYDCKLYFIPFKNKEREYLEKSCTYQENIDNKEIICLMGQDWNKEYNETGECLWNKIVIFDKKDNYYYLRSFAKTELRGGDNKKLDPSRCLGWYIDYSTISAPAEFWDNLKDNLKDIDSKEELFWKEYSLIKNRSELIESLKKNLTDEEKLYLCEFI